MNQAPQQPTTRARIDLFNTGYCLGENRIVHPDGPRGKVAFHAVCALVRPPAGVSSNGGLILFDTGYSTRFNQVTERFPYRLHRWATPVHCGPGQSVAEQLRTCGIDPDSIRHVVISHFHADHIAGLRDFANAELWCSAEAFAEFRRLGPLRGTMKGYLGPLAPDDLAHRVRHPEVHLPAGRAGRLGSFEAWDWMPGLRFVSLPGHARGQIGLQVQNCERGEALLVADGAWSRRAIRERVRPSRLVSLFVDDYKQLVHTLDGLHDLQFTHPELVMIPTHGSDVAEEIEARKSGSTQPEPTLQVSA